jgi:hypothetical protein
LERLTALCGERPELRELAVQVDRNRPLAEVARELADSAGLSGDDWQTMPLLFNPPALAPVALALVAEIHGRSGGFPTILNIRPIEDVIPTRFELGEVVDLRRLRDEARNRR